MAPLPEYRGCNQFSFAILNGDREFGTTLHRIEEGIDSGDILAERRFPIAEDVTVQELYTVTFEESVKLFEDTLPRLVDQTYTLCPQEAYRATRKSSIHYRKDIEALKRIDLAASEEEIYRRIRATAMPGFAPPYALVGRHKIEFQLRNQ
jgi:methionyl-tRNA formyltransferase